MLHNYNNHTKAHYILLIFVEKIYFGEIIRIHGFNDGFKVILNNKTLCSILVLLYHSSADPIRGTIEFDIG